MPQFIFPFLGLNLVILRPISEYCSRKVASGGSERKMSVDDENAKTSLVIYFSSAKISSKEILTLALEKSKVN